MKCSDVMKVLEQHSATHYAEDWDIVGLLAGRRDREVSSVFVALDATEELIDEAIRLSCDMIVTHHPMIFRAMKRVTDEDFIGRRIVKLLRYDLCYYAMHTNFDVMGMADAAADELRLSERRVLDVTYEDELSREGIIGTKRGRAGGYWLAKSPAEVSYGDIVRITRGSLALVPCAARLAYEPCDNCVPESECHLHLVMLAVRDATADVLDRLTLADRLPGSVDLAAPFTAPRGVSAAAQ